MVQPVSAARPLVAHTSTVTGRWHPGVARAPHRGGGGLAKTAIRCGLGYSDPARAAVAGIGQRSRPRCGRRQGRPAQRRGMTAPRFTWHAQAGFRALRYRRGKLPSLWRGAPRDVAATTGARGEASVGALRPTRGLFAHRQPRAACDQAAQGRRAEPPRSAHRWAPRPPMAGRSEPACLSLAPGAVVGPPPRPAAGSGRTSRPGPSRVFERSPQWRIHACGTPAAKNWRPRNASRRRASCPAGPSGPGRGGTKRRAGKPLLRSSGNLRRGAAESGRAQPGGCQRQAPSGALRSAADAVPTQRRVGSARDRTRAFGRFSAAPGCRTGLQGPGEPRDWYRCRRRRRRPARCGSRAAPAAPGAALHRPRNGKSPRRNGRLARAHRRAPSKPLPRRPERRRPAALAGRPARPVTRAPSCWRPSGARGRAKRCRRGPP